MMTTPHDSPLNHPSTVYPKTYDKSVLFPVPRQTVRQTLGVGAQLPFFGYDLWNGWEICWLNPKGRPCVAIGVFIFPCEAPRIVESKSLKLYLNSLNGSNFASIDEVSETIRKDLSAAAGADVDVKMIELDQFDQNIAKLTGTCLDDLDIDFDPKAVSTHFLSVDKSAGVVTESLVSHLLKSNCPVTNQPDWASIQINYTGKKLDHKSVLRYILSFRDHNEFHEQCVERIFLAFKETIMPTELTVYARYTRRGGIDINPFRSLKPNFEIANPRLIRQ